MPYNEFGGMEIDNYGLLLGFETWDPGNTGKQTILVTWDPGNTGTQAILIACEPGNTGNEPF